MNRRSFLQFFGVSAAAAASAKTLISLEEVKPKIELIQPKKEIILLKDTFLIPANCVRSIMVYEDGNHQRRYSVSGESDISMGMINKNVSAVIEFLDINGNPVTDRTYINEAKKLSLFESRVEFDLPDLRGETYLVHQCDLSASAKKLVSCEIHAMKILRSKDYAYTG